MSKCPDINNKEYKALASKVGSSIAHTIYDRNNGNPVSLMADGNPSIIYNQLVSKIGVDQAIKKRSEMFTNSFMSMANDIDKLSMNEQGVIEMPKGELINLISNQDNFKAKKEYQVRQEFIETGEHLETVISTLERALPGFDIHRETFSSLANTPNKNNRAFVDSNGIHFNMQSMHYDTPIHEASHLWIHALEVGNPEQYSLFMDKVKSSMNDNKELVQVIHQKYPDLTPQRLAYEYAATIAGITSVDQVKKFLHRNNHYVKDSRAKSIWTRIADIVNSFYNSVRTIMSTSTLSNENVSELGSIDWKNGTLDDIFKAFTNDVLSGNSVIDFGPTEKEQFMNRYYGNSTFEASDDLNPLQVPITNIADLKPYIMRRFDVNTLNTKNDDIIARKIADSMHKNTTKGVFSYWDMGKPYEYPISMDYEVRVQKVKDEILSSRNTFVESFNDKIIFAITQYKTNGQKPETLRDHIVQAFDGQRLQPSQISEIIVALKVMGIDNPMTEIMSYQSLKDHNTYYDLYDSFIGSKGFNPLIIVHTDSSKTLDISVIDLAAGKLGRQDNLLSSNQYRLGDAFGANKKDFTYGNSVSDIRNVMVTTAVAALNKKVKAKGMKLKIRKMGVIGFNNFKVTTRIISNTNEAFANARTLLQLPQVNALFDKNISTYNKFMDLIDDNNAWDATNILQSWKNILESYYATYREDLGLTQDQVDDFFRDENFLRKRQKEIEVKKNGIEFGKDTKEYLSDPEHKIISIYLLNKKFHININNSQMKDIDKTFYKVTNPHNVKHDAIQMFSKAAEETKAIVINKLNDFKDEFTSLLDASLKSHGKSIKLIGNLPENIFGHLFRKGNVHLQEDYKNHKKGDIIEVALFNKIHGSYDLAAAKAAGLTTEDIKFADFILEQTKKRFIDNRIHIESMTRTDIDVDKIRKELEEKIMPGTIPVMPQTTNELMRKGQVLKAARKGYDKVGKGEYTIGEMTEQDYTQINSLFTRQADIDDQLRQMGLESMSKSDTDFIGLDMETFYNNTMNIEYAMNMFMHDGIRKTELDDRLLPTYNNVLQWLNVIKYDFGKGSMSQETTELFLKQYMDRIVYRKNQDSDWAGNSFLRNGLNAFSFVALGYRPVVWMRSGYYNLQNATLGSLATMASNIGTEEARRLNFPNPTEVTKAHAKFFTDFSKIYQLGKKFSIINSSEMDAIESIFTTSADRNIFRNQLAQLGNYYTDIASRLITMTAFMIHDGSYDAHTFDKENNKLKYDRTKDARFYKDGKWKSDNAKAIFDSLLVDQINVGLATSIDDMTVGYDFDDANSRFKWYSDKYIIGSMDEYQKILLGNTAMGAMMTQFRNYLPDKLFNLLGTNRLTSYGTERTISMNEDNEIEVIKKQMQIEGTAASLWYMLSDVYELAKMKDLSIESLNEMFREMDPMRKHNLGMTIAKATLFTGILTGLAILSKAGLSDRDRDKLEWTYSELLVWNWYEDLKSNIIPISSMIDNIMSMVTGQANWTRALRYAGPVYDAIWLLELLGDKDDILMNYRSRKKVADMNAEELKEHVEKVKQAKIIREKNLNNKE